MAATGNREIFSVGDSKNKQQRQQNVVAVKIQSLIEFALLRHYSQHLPQAEWGGGEGGGRFSNVPKSFRTWKAVAKFRTL